MANIEFEFDVFLNYHSTDRANVQMLAASLEKEGLRVWWDQTQLEFGENWMQAIAAGVRRSRVVAVCIGPGAEGYWQSKEYQLALNIQQGRGNVVIPLLLPEAPPQLPDFLSLLHAVDFSQGFGDAALWQRFVQAIRGRQQPARPPAAPPAPADDALSKSVEDLIGSLASNNITFVIGSDTSAASAPPCSRDSDIARQLMISLIPPPKTPPFLMPSDFAAQYYAVSKRDTGLETAIMRIVDNRVDPATGVHNQLAALLPKLMSFPRRRGLKPARQWIVSTSYDTLLERALIRRGVRFIRIVVPRDGGVFYVNDYRKVQAGDCDLTRQTVSAEEARNGKQGLDDLIRDYSSSTVRGEGVIKFLDAEDLLIPILLKLRGSVDIPDSCTISTNHFFEVARAIVMETALMDLLGQVLKTTGVVFLGMGFVLPEFRLASHALFRGSFESGRPRYLYQMAPNSESSEEMERLEAVIWQELKNRAKDRGLTVVESPAEVFLAALAQSVESARG